MTSTASISVQSPAFAEGQPIPRRYTCDGDNVSPPLSWTGLPAGTGSVALVVDDPDAPSGTYTRWVVVNVAPTVTSFDQDPSAGERPTGRQQRRSGPSGPSWRGRAPELRVAPLTGCREERVLSGSRRWRAHLEWSTCATC
jgi:phosphatidylethanolamine-binding protein (PEBP) family uncharacterized protein